MNDCWNSVGVQGDGSCPELKSYAHCHNCPVYAGAAAELLTQIPVNRGADHSSQLARIAVDEEPGTEATLVFRIGQEWLGLSIASVCEITRPARVHTVPHRQSRFARGIVNVRGELLLFASLDVLLGIEPSTGPGLSSGGPTQRMLVMRHEDVRAASVVDEVHGVLRFPTRVRRDVPLTLARASASYVKHLVTWKGRSIGLLETGALFHKLHRSTV